jgi:hypothetical protein
VEITTSPLIITSVAIGFPAGCVDLVRAWVEYLSARIFPINQSGYFVGNGQIIEFVTDTVILDEPRVLSFKAANYDDTYSHNIWIKLDIQFLQPDKQTEQKDTVVSVNYPMAREV